MFITFTAQIAFLLKYVPEKYKKNTTVKRVKKSQEPQLSYRNRENGMDLFVVLIQETAITSMRAF